MSIIKSAILRAATCAFTNPILYAVREELGAPDFAILKFPSIFSWQKQAFHI